MVIVYNEDKLNSIFNDPNFLLNHEKYDLNKILKLEDFLNNLDINKNYHKSSINKNKKHLTPESLKIKNINILLNKCNEKNINDIKNQIVEILSEDKDIIVLIIDNILEKCIIQIQYIKLYINIILDLYKKCDYNIEKKIEKMKSYNFHNSSIKNNYDGLCDFNKNVDDCIGLCMLIYHLYEFKLIDSVTDTIDILFDNIILDDDDICFKYISCIYNIFESLDISYIKKYNEQLKSLMYSKISKKNKFKIMDILEMV
jgi:hypothetical protein